MSVGNIGIFKTAEAIENLAALVDLAISNVDTRIKELDQAYAAEVEMYREYRALPWLTRLFSAPPVIDDNDDIYAFGTKSCLISLRLELVGINNLIVHGADEIRISSKSMGNIVKWSKIP